MAPLLISTENARAATASAAAARAAVLMATRRASAAARRSFLDAGVEVDMRFCDEQELDCVVARAPRNDDFGVRNPRRKP
jgi:hypothetical protein